MSSVSTSWSTHKNPEHLQRHGYAHSITHTHTPSLSLTTNQQLQQQTKRVTNPVPHTHTNNSSHYLRTDYLCNRLTGAANGIGDELYAPPLIVMKNLLSASDSTTWGLLPPNSNVTHFKLLWAAIWGISCPICDHTVPQTSWQQSQ